MLPQTSIARAAIVKAKKFTSSLRFTLRLSKGLREARNRLTRRKSLPKPVGQTLAAALSLPVSSEEVASDCAKPTHGQASSQSAPISTSELRGDMFRSSRQLLGRSASRRTRRQASGRLLGREDTGLSGAPAQSVPTAPAAGAGGPPQSTQQGLKRENSHADVLQAISDTSSKLSSTVGALARPSILKGVEPASPSAGAAAATTPVAEAEPNIVIPGRIESPKNSPAMSSPRMLALRRSGSHRPKTPSKLRAQSSSRGLAPSGPARRMVAILRSSNSSRRVLDRNNSGSRRSTKSQSLRNLHGKPQQGATRNGVAVPAAAPDLHSLQLETGLKPPAKPADETVAESEDKAPPAAADSAPAEDSPDEAAAAADPLAAAADVSAAAAAGAPSTAVTPTAAAQSTTDLAEHTAPVPRLLNPTPTASPARAAAASSPARSVKADSEIRDAVCSPKSQASATVAATDAAPAFADASATAGIVTSGAKVTGPKSAGAEFSSVLSPTNRHNVPSGGGSGQATPLATTENRELATKGGSSRKSLTLKQADAQVVGGPHVGLVPTVAMPARQGRRTSAATTKEPPASTSALDGLTMHGRSPRKQPPVSGKPKLGPYRVYQAKPNTEPTDELHLMAAGRGVSPGPTS